MMHSALLIQISFLLNYVVALKLPLARVHERATPGNSSATFPSAITLQVPIDHFKHDARNYSNRYWINSTYYKPGGPVFFLDAGEIHVTQDVLDIYLNEATAKSSTMQLVRAHKGLAVVWEHRFYGESLPFPINSTTGVAVDGARAYKYLTIEQALEDAVYLARNFRPPGLRKHWKKLAHTSTPWIFVGGSYPGMRAAWSRIRTPEVWFASWASSAPVETHLLMETYYGQFALDMTANCTADLKAAVAYFDGVLRKGSQLEITKIKTALYIANNPSVATAAQAYSDAYFSLEAADISDEAAAQLLLGIFPPNLQQSGFTNSMLSYCTYLEQYATSSLISSTVSQYVNMTLTNNQSGTITDQGIAAQFGDRAAFEAVTSTIYQLSTDLAKANFSLAAEIGNSQSWTWQTCSELGFAQVSNLSSPTNVVSKYYNVSTYLNDCHTLFNYTLLAPTPNVSAGLRYGGWNMAPSNVMFTNGLKDPWHTLSVASTTEAYGAPHRCTTSRIPACNVPPAGTDVFGLAFPNGYHIEDLSSDFGSHNTSADMAVALFSKALAKWLPCFKAK